MKLKLSKIAQDTPVAQGDSAFIQFVKIIKTLSLNKTRKIIESFKPTFDNDKSDEFNLYVDIVKNTKDKYSNNSQKIEIVIYTGESIEFSNNSIPCINFSLSSLIDEKIELLDASLLQQNDLDNLKEIAYELGNLSHLLKEAIKRHEAISGRFIDKNPPLW